MQILSLGLGLQSTALYYMSALGQLPRIDAAVFADTGAERASTLDYLRRVLIPWARVNNGPIIIHVTGKNLATDLLTWRSEGAFVSIPAYTIGPDGKEAMIQRQCTNQYKIQQVNSGIRQAQGLAPRKHTRPTTVWLGITTDEITRMFTPDTNWKTHHYPFLGYRVSTAGHVRVPGLSMSRQDVAAWYTRHGIEAPPKSSCYMCPFQSDAAWKALKSDGSGDWQRAVEVDHAIRNATSQGTAKPIYLHRSMKPLDQVEFIQGDLWEECSGYCHA